MNVLIIDDDASKIQVLAREFGHLGIAEGDLYVANDAAQARKLLVDHVFDIMLIDILLPARAGAQPTGTTSVELLKQIVDDGTSRAPKYIIGITASADALQQYESDFRALTFQIVQVAPAEEEWKGFLSNLLLFIKRTREAEETFDYDLCVLTALRSPELDAAIRVWSPTLQSEEPLTSSVLVRKGTVSVDGVTKRVAFAHPGQMGLVAATHAADALLRAYRPRLLVMTGICGGFADHTCIGDVVVADKSWDWQAGKWAQAGTLLSAPDQKEGSYDLVAIARSVEEKLNTFQTEFQGNSPREFAKIIPGPMVSGSSVVASVDIQNVFRTQHRKMVAVDMECYGVYYAASMTDGARPKVLCIKAVSDLADRTKGDDFQKYCAYLSARVMKEVVDRYWQRFS